MACSDCERVADAKWNGTVGQKPEDSKHYDCVYYLTALRIVKTYSLCKKFLEHFNPYIASDSKTITGKRQQQHQDQPKQEP